MFFLILLNKPIFEVQSLMVEVVYRKFGVWRLMFGVHSRKFGVRRSKFGAQSRKFGVQSLIFRVRSLIFGVQRLMFGVQNLMFGVRTLIFGALIRKCGVRRFMFEGAYLEFEPVDRNSPLKYHYDLKFSS